MTQPPHQPGWWQPPNTPHQAPHQPLPQQPGPQQPQFGGGFQAQYGGLGAFGDQQPRRSKKPWLIGGAVVLVLAVGAGTAWLLGAFRGDVLDQGSLQESVTAVLRDSYGEHDVANAQCPGGQAATNGTTFECTVDVAGRPRTVSIRVLNDKPEVEVGMPR